MLHQKENTARNVLKEHTLKLEQMFEDKLAAVETRFNDELKEIKVRKYII